MIVSRLGTVTKNVFAGDISIPPLRVASYKDVPIFYEWNPDITKVTKVLMSWAAETSGWTPGTGQVLMGVAVSDKLADSHTFLSPGQYTNYVDITSLFFNGPNLFKLHSAWLYLENLTWITCAMRVDITITYEGETPPPPTTDEEWKKYLPYIGLGIGGGILFYLATRRS
jgi:hypothetical protein